MATAAMGDPLSEFLERRWWAIALRGTFAILFGIICFVNPLLAGLSLVIWFGIFAIADGIAALVASIGKARRGERWVWLAVEAVASIIIGVLVLAMPAMSIVVLYLIIAIKTLVTGILLLGASVKLGGKHGQAWMIASALVSLLLAAALFAAPLLGAKVLVWWIGGWAIVFGIAMVALGFKLKSFARQ